MTEDAVTDSTCLIALDRINQLHLLSSVFSNVFAPPAVVQELGKQFAFLTITPVGNPALVQVLNTQLDPGESEAIALSMELACRNVVLDDKKARRIANQLGLRVVGTLGVLLRAKRLGVIAAVAPLLADLRAKGFHMTTALEEKALRLAEEETSKT